MRKFVSAFGRRLEKWDGVVGGGGARFGAAHGALGLSPGKVWRVVAAFVGAGCASRGLVAGGADFAPRGRRQQLRGAVGTDPAVGACGEGCKRGAFGGERRVAWGRWRVSRGG